MSTLGFKPPQIIRNPRPQSPPVPASHLLPLSNSIPIPRSRFPSDARIHHRRHRPPIPPPKRRPDSIPESSASSPPTDEGLPEPSPEVRFLEYTKLFPSNVINGVTLRDAIASSISCTFGVRLPCNEPSIKPVPSKRVSFLELPTLQKALDAQQCRQESKGGTVFLASTLAATTPECPHTAAANYTRGFVIADLDPSIAKLAIGITGPFLSAFGFLFIVRIVMSWYPKLPVGKFPYVLAYVPTEPLLGITRKLIPPVGGVDVTPVVWFGLVSFLNEILVGPQGLLVLLSQQV